MKSFSLIFLRFYVKLQDAYVSEKGDKLGNWNAIGYKMPSSATFHYYDGSIEITDKTGKSSEAASDVDLTSGISPAWKAVPQTALNDCPTGTNSAWIINVTASTSGEGDAAKTEGGAAIYEATNSNADCLALTPSFTKLTTKATKD